MHLSPDGIFSRYPFLTNILQFTFQKALVLNISLFPSVVVFYASTCARRTLSSRCLRSYTPEKLVYFTQELHFFILHALTPFSTFQGSWSTSQINATIKNLISGKKINYFLHTFLQLYSSIIVISIWNLSINTRT